MNLPVGFFIYLMPLKRYSVVPFRVAIVSK